MGLNHELFYQNIFPTAEAIVQKVGDKQILAYTIDDITRNEQDCLKLVYSIKTNDNTWSEPLAIKDDGTLDSSFCFVDNFIVWKNFKEKLPASTDNFTDIMKKSEIVVSQFNGTKWSEPINLTNNDIADFSPKLATNGNKAAVAWLSNTASDISGENGQTDINYCIYDGSSWSNVTKIENVGQVGNIELAYNGTDLLITYMLNNKLYKNIHTDPIAEDITQYQITYFNNKFMAVYFDESGNLTVIEDLTDTAVKTVIETNADIYTSPIITNDSSHLYICWVDNESGYNNLSGVSFINNKWSEKMTMIQGEFNVKGPSISINDNKLTAAYLREEPVTMIEEADDITYEGGKCDLYVTEIIPSNNIAVGYVEYNEEIYKYADTAAIECYIKNIGENEIEKLKIEIYESNDLKSTILTDDVLKAGEVKSLNFMYKPTNGGILQDIKIKVLSQNVTDLDLSDNEVIMSLGIVDASVESAYISEENGTYFINSIIQNMGSINAENFNIQVRQGSETGDVIYETTYNDVLPNEIFYLHEEISNIVFESKMAKYFVTVEAEGDSVIYNNKSLAVMREKEAEKFSVTALNQTISDKTINTNLLLENFTEENKNYIIVLALYDVNDKFEDISIKSLSDVSEDGIYEINLEYQGTKDKLTYKIFVWDGLNTMVPIQDILSGSINFE